MQIHYKKINVFNIYFGFFSVLRVRYLLKIRAFVNVIKKILTLLSLIVQKKNTTVLSLKDKNT
jgi:hypothetical protein